MLPAAIRSALGLTPGTRMLLSTEEDGSLRLRPYRAVADKNRGRYANLAENGSLVDDLLAERRAEAAREQKMPKAASQAVLDASALLAYLDNEVGSDVVAEAIADGASISTINLAEALSTLAVRGANPADVVADLTAEGVLNGAITVEPFTNADSIQTARLRPMTRSAGLSLGDRSCLVLAHRLSTHVLTADQAWVDLTLGVDVHPIRHVSR